MFFLSWVTHVRKIQRTYDQFSDENNFLKEILKKEEIQI